MYDLVSCLMYLKLKNASLPWSSLCSPFPCWETSGTADKIVEHGASGHSSPQLQDSHRSS